MKLAGFIFLGVLAIVVLLVTALRKHEEDAIWGWLFGIALALGAITGLSKLIFS